VPPSKSATSDCIFCRIVRREAPASILYEDEHAMAFLDIFPLSRGHTLVVPKQHVDRLTDLPATEYAPILSGLSEVCRRIERLSPHYNVGVNQGSLAGQIVFHLHFHVIPRYADRPAFPRQRSGITADEAKELLGILSPSGAASP
jgi:histidine triad (HIT) family protein